LTLFGWLALWGGQPTIDPPIGDNMANGAPPYFVNDRIDLIKVYISYRVRTAKRCHNVTNSNR
jgi:hypothetical protein